MPRHVFFVFYHAKLKREENNLGVVRLFAACLVVLGHCPVLLGQISPQWDLFKFLFGMNMAWFGVVVFFVVSGFLVASSWDRRESGVSFLISRVLRVYPAAIAVILLSVCVLAPLLTVLPLHQYVWHTQTANYLKNLSLFRVYYPLPGVFDGNPHPSSVNGSLWTLPYELTCYLILWVLGTCSLLRARIVVFAVWLCVFCMQFFVPNFLSSFVIPVLAVDLGHLYPLFLFFFTGTLFYYTREYMQYSLFGGVVAFICIVVASRTGLNDYASLFFLPYLLFSFSFAVQPIFPAFFSKTDISYGIYLFAFPIQQTFVSFGGGNLSVLALALLTLSTVIPCAFMSWVYVEQPFLRMRQPFEQYVSRLLFCLHS